MEKAPNWARLRWRWKFSPSGEKWGEKREQERGISFFHFFHLFRQSPPLKIFKFKMQPLHPPSHHEHHTTVLPTRHPTRWSWFFCDRMSLIRMISSHGYQNCLSPPTSKPSCDRYTQPPKIKPTPPCSPDDALHAHMSIMGIEADFPIFFFFFFFPFIDWSSCGAGQRGPLTTRHKNW